MEGQELLDELSEIFDKCMDFIDARNHSKFAEMANYYILKADGVDKLNMLKTIMVATKGVPVFFPEITDARQKVKDEHNRLHWKTTGSKPF